MTSKLHLTFALIAGTAMLAGCGDGGGGGVNSAASVPLPNPNAVSVGYSFSALKPLDPAPAWTTGNYQGIAVVNDELSGKTEQAPAGTVSLAVDRATKSYVLTVGTGSVAVEPVKFSIPSLANPTSCSTCWTDSYVGSTVKAVVHWSDGVARPETDGTGDATAGSYSSKTTVPGQKVVESSLGISSIPGRHVSLGYWSLREAPLNPDGSPGVTSAWSSGNFAFGDRTSPGDIPASGTARYKVETPSDSYSGQLINLTLFDVDFAARSIAATASRSLELDLYPNGDVCCYGNEEILPNPATRVATMVLSTNASGTAPISSAGSFDIALAGTGRVHTERTDSKPVADISSPVSGSISGAFFGPQASELGGSFRLPRLDPEGTVSDQFGAFTAVKSGP